METNTRAIARRLQREGWRLVRHGGNHEIYEHPDTEAVIRLPRHRVVSIGIARQIANLAGWTERG